MTPDKLREMVAAATQEDDFGLRADAKRDLQDIAPELAEVAAEMAEALGELVAAIETNSEQGAPDYAFAALARFSALGGES